MSLLAGEQIVVDWNALDGPTIEVSVVDPSLITAATDTEFSANETWPVMNKPRKVFRPEDIVWDHTVEPMGSYADIEFFDEEHAGPDVQKPASRLAEAFQRFKTSTIGKWAHKTANWIRSNKTEAVAYCIGAAAMAQAGYSVKQGVADMHMFETLSNAALTFADLKDIAPQNTAEPSAGQHFLTAGIGGLASVCAVATGLFARRGTETTLPREEPRLGPYDIERPTEYYFMTTEQLRERAEQLKVQAYYLRVLRFLPKPQPSVYYADSFTQHRPTFGTVHYSDTFDPVTDPKTFYDSISWKQPVDPEVLPMDFVPPVQKPPVVEPSLTSRCSDLLGQLDETLAGIRRDLALIPA